MSLPWQIDYEKKNANKTIILSENLQPYDQNDWMKMSAF